MDDWVETSTQPVTASTTPRSFVQPGAYKVRDSAQTLRSALRIPYYTAGNPACTPPTTLRMAQQSHIAGLRTVRPPRPFAHRQGSCLSRSPVSEGTDGLAWVDLDGHKVGA